MLTATIAATVHGRYIFDDRSAERLLVGFHGYGEAAEASFGQLATIRGVERWSVLAIQALHPFYTRTGEVVANWMTRQDRELAIADNIEYVRRVIEAVGGARRVLVFSGFSQGAAMAARAAAHIRCAGLIMLGGEVPPDVRRDDVVLPPVLLARGSRDDWYNEEKHQNDLRFLEPRTRVTRCAFEGGHEWSDAFREAAATFLDSYL